MNRSILIVICDFLLVSLLAFSSVDINQVAQEGRSRPMQSITGTNSPAAREDLAAVMSLALEEERRNREQLMGELARSRAESEQQVALLVQREQQVQTFQQQLQQREQEAQRLERERMTLQAQFATAQTNLQALGQQLQSSSAEAALSKERLAEIEAEAKRQAQQAAALQDQLAALARSNQVVLNEKQRLAGQLQVAEVEKRHAVEQVTRMTEEVKIQREEKERLAEGVKALAKESGELVQEIRENRPLAPNMVFNNFLSNRVTARFVASRTGLFGNEPTRREQTRTILVSDGTNTVALCHVQDTPLVLSSPGTAWEQLSGILVRNGVQTPIRQLSFSWPDPRIVWFPVTQEQAQRLGGSVYSLSSDPYKFQDAVLVGTAEAYYGECRFQIDPAAQDYLQLDRSFLRGLFGKFNPSRGDLVFSRTGELLGVMVNGTHCLMVRKFDPAATLQFGDDVRAQRVGETLASLYFHVSQLPVRLQ
jgi:hypothetical protein